MNATRVTVLLLVIAAFVAGGLLGYVLSESKPGAATEIARDERGPDPREVHRVSTTLAGRETSGTVTRPLAPGRAPSDAEDARPRPAALEPEASLEVLVTDAAGEPVRAQVFAFPRDAPEWDEAPQGYQQPPGPCRLRIPVPGRYDVFARSQSPPGAAGLEDVEVRAGETVRVQLAYDEGRPIRLVPVQPWPIEESLRRGLLEGSIWVRAIHAKGWRGDPDMLGYAWGATIPLDPAGGPWVTPPLPASLAYEIQVGLQVPASLAKEGDPAPSYGVVAEPAVAQAGDTVRLHARLYARLHLFLGAADPDAWPEGPIEIHVHLEHAAGSREYRCFWRRRDGFLRATHPRILSGPSGPARVTWDGPGVAGGALEGLLLDPDRTLERRVAIQLDPEELPSREPLAVQVSGLSNDAAFNENVELEMAVLLAADEQGWRPRLAWSDDPTPRIELDYGWRRARHLVAWQGRRLVARPAAVPAQGPVHVALEPAGLLVVVPDRLPPEDLGVLIRRTDGLPFLVGPEGREEPLLRIGAVVGPGDFVGPLPAGRHVFEVELMGRRLADAVADVEPGRVGVLRIRW